MATTLLTTLDSKCVGELQALPPAGYAEGYVNNTCILQNNASYYITINIPGHCDGSDHSVEAFAAGFIAANNTVYVPGGNALVSCNHVNINASAFMTGGKTPQWNASRGYDNSSRVSGDMPSVATIIGWAEGLLAMP